MHDPAVGTHSKCSFCVQCKHQLAARLARALRRCPVITVADQALVQLLLAA